MMKNHFNVVLNFLTDPNEQNETIDPAEGMVSKNVETTGCAGTSLSKVLQGKHTL